MKQLTKIVCGHPERKHGGRGLCTSCYMTVWNRDHPDSNSGPGWHRRNPDRSRRLIREQNYRRVGSSLEEYERLWEAQSGRCANKECGKSYDRDVKDYRQGLQVDHDHRTGEVRGLLCPRCNTALGHVDDNKEVLAGLIQYLESLN